MIHIKRYIWISFFFFIISVGFSQEAVEVSGYLSSNQRHFRGCPMDIIAFSSKRKAKEEEEEKELYFYALNVDSDDNTLFRLFNNNPYKSDNPRILAQSEDYLKYRLSYKGKFFLGVSFVSCRTGEYRIRVMLTEEGSYDEYDIRNAEVKDSVEVNEHFHDLGENIIPREPYSCWDCGQ